jgi:dienelactone hydrolase
VKVRILIGVLVLSLLANVAGLIFFISFLKLRGQYKVVKRDNDQMSQNLAIIRGRGVLPDALDASGRIYRRLFVSHFDGQEDAFALMPPTAPRPLSDLTLVVYLHGMGSSYIEPFVWPEHISIGQYISEHDPKICLASLSYRGKASWGSDAAMADITQNIRQVCHEFPIKKIVLMGTSMGGCTVLTYAEKAPPDIKEKLVGIVSVESAGDLVSLYNESEHPQVKSAMIEAFGGTPEQKPDVYKSKSFLSDLSLLPSSVDVAVVSARQDNIVPPDLQKKIVSELEARQIRTKLIEIDGGHGCPPAEIYLQGLDFVTSGS